MSRRSACSRGKDPKGNISSKFANSPYLNSVQPSRQSSASSTQKEKTNKCQGQDEEKNEKPHVESTVVAEQPKQSRRRGERGRRSIKTHAPRGSDSSVSSYVTHQSIRSSKTRQSSRSLVRASSSVSRARARIDILLPSEVEKMLMVFSSKHKSESHNPSAKIVQDDDSTIADATSIDDSLIYREYSDEVFSSDLFAKIMARDPDQEGPTLTLEASVDGNVSDLESIA
eukprot:scaffold19486_cov105-Skeletonema_dohrnii-CCMP3373.AAC.7